MIIEELRNFLIIILFTSVITLIVYTNNQYNMYKAKIPLIIHDYIEKTDNVLYIKKYNTGRKLFYNYRVYFKNNSCDSFENYINQTFSGKLKLDFICDNGIVYIDGKYNFLPFNK